LDNSLYADNGNRKDGTMDFTIGGAILIVIAMTGSYVIGYMEGKDEK